jgi:hypothetical protein
MPPLTDPDFLACYKNALSNWRYEGYINFTALAQDWIRINLSNTTPREIGRLMHEYVAGGGEIDQQRETRPEWNMHGYHFDLRIPTAGRLIYIETRLFYADPADPDDPVIQVVNVHDA